MGQASPTLASASLLYASPGYLAWVSATSLLMSGPFMNPNIRTFALWAIIFVLVLALFTLFQNPGQRGATQETAGCVGQRLPAGRHDID